MTIFKEVLDEEYLTISEAKQELAAVEAELAADEDREMRYELHRAIEHVNRFASLDPEQARDLVADLQELEGVDEATAYKIADLKPEDRDDVRAIYAQERYSLSGDELDAIIDTVAQYV